jgi:hypothetical protein
MDIGARPRVWSFFNVCFHSRICFVLCLVYILYLMMVLVSGDKD